MDITQFLGHSKHLLILFCRDNNYIIPSYNITEVKYNLYEKSTILIMLTEYMELKNHNTGTNFIKAELNSTHTTINISFMDSKGKYKLIANKEF